MMELLQLYALSFIGTIVWVLNAEVATVMYAGMDDAHSPPVLGLVASMGQCTMYLAFLYGGTHLSRWSKIQTLVKRTQDRFGEKLETGFMSLTVTAAFIGIPPVIALVVLAKPFKMSAGQVIIIAFVGRFVRFTVLALFGDALPFYHLVAGDGA